MGKIKIDVLSLEDCVQWDILAKNGIGSNVFQNSWYLKHCCVSKVIGAFQEQTLIAGFPLYEAKDKKSMIQSTLYVPYSGPIFHPNWSKKHIQRTIAHEFIYILQKRYSHIKFSLSPQLHDIVPYLNSSFMPEVRYTYVLDLSHKWHILESRFSKNRKIDLQRAKMRGVHIVKDRLFSIDQILFWNENRDSIRESQRIMDYAEKTGHGQAFTALNTNGEPIGGIFLLFDSQTAYSVMSFVADEYKQLGVGTALYTYAIKYSQDTLNMHYFDFEGSVLKGVERFYMQFGGKQTLYFNLHWNRSQTEYDVKDLYGYEI